VPNTSRVGLEGTLATGVGAKDVALELVRVLGRRIPAFSALEFHGPAAEAMPDAERMVLSNMSVEMGAMAGLFDVGRLDVPRLDGGLFDGGQLDAADAEARGARGGDGLRARVLDVSALEPQVALPHDPGNSVPVVEAEGRSVDWVFLGTCTGGRAHDFREALRVLRAGGGIASGVTMVVTPPSRAVRTAIEADGTLDAFAALGAIVTETGCGPCCGTSGPLPPASAKVLSTANRNFRARMGDPSVNIMLASPATCAAAATRGRVVDPRTFS